MIQNLKVDIIYYMTATDFEMEFNLCGCCRMRLLTDKAADRKSFLNMLSRAVNRSRIILSCGNLFGQNGLINTVSTAIRARKVLLNNSEFGINLNGPIEIIDGSTPLVTPDGIFGGCIIESGPQTIILLSENRQIRKVIMQTLIHPYIEDVNMLLAASGGSASSANSAPQAAVEEVEPEVQNNSEPETLCESVPEENSEEQNAPDDFEEIHVGTVEPDENDTSEVKAVITASDEEPEIHPVEAVEESEEATVVNETPAKETDVNKEKPVKNKKEKKKTVEFDEPFDDETDLNLFIEPKHAKLKETDSYLQNYVPSEDDALFVSGDPDNDYKKPKKKSNLSLPIIIVLIILITILCVLAYMLVYVPSRDGVSIIDNMKNIFGLTAHILI